MRRGQKSGCHWYGEVHVAETENERISESRNLVEVKVDRRLLRRSVQVRNTTRAIGGGRSQV